MGEGVAAYDSLIGLYRHVHQAGYKVRCLCDELGVYARVHVYVLVAAQRHHDLLHRGVAGSFSDAVYGDFRLTCAVEHTGQSVRRSHAEVVVAVRGYYGLVDVLHVIDQIFDFGAVLVGQTVTGCVGNVHHCGAGCDDGFDYAGQILRLCSSGVFCVKLHVLDILFGIAHGLHGGLDYFLGSRAQLVVNVLVRDAYSGVYAFVFGQTQSVRRHVYIFFHRTRECAYGRSGYGFRNFAHRVEVARTRNRKSRLNNIDAEAFE